MHRYVYSTLFYLYIFFKVIKYLLDALSHQVAVSPTLSFFHLLAPGALSRIRLSRFCGSVKAGAKVLRPFES